MYIVDEACRMTLLVHNKFRSAIRVRKELKMYLVKNVKKLSEYKCHIFIYLGALADMQSNATDSLYTLI
jgi:hypothetical protein